VELLVVRFPGSRFTGEIVPALKELVEKDLIRVIDLVLVRKDASGRMTKLEIGDLDTDDYAALDPLIAEVDGFISDDDVERLADLVGPGSSAGLMLFENVWATRFRDAVVNAGGELVLNERIPRSVIEYVGASREEMAESHA
jgi:uncharacterized membrane protein